MNVKDLEYRMYGFVPYNLSPIQQGIQFGHAVVEYQIGYGDSEEYKKWSQFDKTFIVLDGGTTNKTTGRLGTLNQITASLKGLGIKYELFNEPDLGDQLTAVVFLLDERVWNMEKYPSPDFDRENGVYFEEGYAERVADMGGEHILKQRDFIKQFRLA